MRETNPTQQLFMLEGTRNILLLKIEQVLPP